MGEVQNEKKAGSCKRSKLSRNYQMENMGKTLKTKERQENYGKYCQIKMVSKTTKMKIWERGDYQNKIKWRKNEKQKVARKLPTRQAIGKIKVKPTK